MGTFFKFVRLYKLLVALILLCWSLTASGCAALLLGAGGGVAGTVYVMGKLEDEVEASVPKAQQAAIAGLKDLDLPILKKKGDKLTAEIESKTADEKRVWVSIHSLTKSRSKIMIRVGYTGDEIRSRRILEATRTHL